MPDKDLRKQALKGGKTTSRKAEIRSQQSTPASSRPGSGRASRAASRIASRDVSDEEDDHGNLSDDTNQSIDSIDALIASDEFAEKDADAFKEDLLQTIDEMIDRKGSSSEGREEAINRYNRILTSHYHFGDILYGRVDGLLATFLRSIKNETTPRETMLALKAVSLTSISYKTDTLYETVAAQLKKTIADSQDNAVKAAAITALGNCLSFGGGAEGEIAETCTFLLEVVQSDGAFIGAEDSPEVVTAAVQTYSYLLTEVQDVESESEDAVEALMEQLDATDVSVQIAAGEAIALLFEKSYTPREEDESSSEDQEDHEDHNSQSHDKSLVKRYNAYHNPSEVLEKVQALANLSSKSLNKHDKRKLHQTFFSIVITLEQPRAGLRTNNSSKKLVRIGREGDLKVDKWWKLMRLNQLRRLLGGGFVNHYFEGNPMVLHSLPVLVRSAGLGALSPRRTPRKGDRYREARRFVSAEV